MVTFRLSMPEYDGTDPLLYNSTDTGIFGMTTWKWVYDTYGKTLLQLPSTAYHYSFGLLFLTATELNIEFDSETNETEIALLSTNCKHEMVLKFLIQLIADGFEKLTDRYDIVKDNILKNNQCLCHNTVNKSTLMSTCCCISCVERSCFQNITRTCKLVDSEWSLGSVHVILLFIIVALSVTVLPFVSWSLLPNYLNMSHQFTWSNGRANKYISLKHNMLLAIDHAPVTVKNVFTYWNGNVEPNIPHHESKCRWKCFMGNLLWLFFYWCVVPFFAWAYFFIAKFLLDSNYKKESNAWRRFENTSYDPQRIDLYFLPRNLYVMPYIFGAYMFVLCIFVFCLREELSKVECIVHAGVCKATKGTDTSGDETDGEGSPCIPENEQNISCQLCDKFVFKSTKPFCCLHSAYERFIFAFLRHELKCNKHGRKYENVHIYVNIVDVCRDINSFLLKMIIKCKDGFSSIFTKSKDEYKRFTNLTVTLWISLFFVTLCIDYVLFLDVCFLTQVIACIMAAVTLHADIVVPYLSLVVVIFSYVVFVYRGFTTYYERLKEITFKVIQEWSADDKKNTKKLFAYYRTDILNPCHCCLCAQYKLPRSDCCNDQGSPNNTMRNGVATTFNVSGENNQERNNTSENGADQNNQATNSTPENGGQNSQSSDCSSQIQTRDLLYVCAPFIRGRKWRECITHELFSYVCEHIYPVRLKFRSAICQFLIMSFILSFLFFVIMSFDITPLVTASLTAGLGFLPKLRSMIWGTKKIKDGDPKYRQTYDEVHVVIEKFLAKDINVATQSSSA